MKKALLFLVLIAYGWSLYCQNFPQDTLAPAVKKQITSFLSKDSIILLDKNIFLKLDEKFDFSDTLSIINVIVDDLSRHGISIKKDAIVFSQENQFEFIPANLDANPLFSIEETVEGTYIAFETRPSFKIPFLKNLSNINTRLVVHKPNLNYSHSANLTFKSYFTPDGTFLGLESIEKIRDPRRMAKATVEKGMNGIGHKIIGVVKDDSRINYDSLWQAIANRVNLAEITEINMYPVIYEIEDNIQKTKVVINIWGPKNPLGIPEVLPDYLKNRIRLIYDPIDHSWFADNFL